MKSFFLISAILFTGLFSDAQIPIAFYDFENNSSRTTFENQVEAEINTSASTLFSLSPVIGVLTNDLGAGIYRGGAAAGRCIVTYDPSASPAIDPAISATHYLQFKVSTEGFAGILLKFDAFPAKPGSEKYGVLYSTNGTVWSFVGSVAAPGTGSYPWTSAAWGSCTAPLPAAADNIPALYIRIYEYDKGHPSAEHYIGFDNVEIGASSTVAGKVFTTLNEADIYTSVTSGLTGSQLTRTNVTISGAGTVATLGSHFKVATGNTFAVTNNGDLNTGNDYAITGAGNFNLSTISEIVVTGAGGISGNGNSGNVQVTGNRTLNPAATYTFRKNNGAQVTGNGLPAVLTGHLKIDNPAGVTLSQSTALSSQSVLYLTKGQLNNSNLLNLSSGSTINRDSGMLAAAPNFPTAINLIYSGSASVTTGNEVPDVKTILQDVTINKTGAADAIVLGKDLHVNGTLYHTKGTLNLADKNITLRSTASATARVNAAGAAAAISYSGTGRFVAERYASYPRKWHLLSIPTDSTQSFKNAWQEGGVLNSNPVPGYGMIITQKTGNTGIGFDGFSPGGPTVKKYNPATNDYTGIINTTDPIKTTQGYFVYLRGDRLSLSSPATTSNPTTLRTKGKLYTGTQTPVPVGAGLMACIGNPYASAIDLTTLTMAGLAGTLPTKGTVYVWDPSITGTYGLGAFQTLTYNGTGYTITPGRSPLYPGTSCKRIESGQAFFVKGLMTGGSVTFTEAAKTTGSNIVSRTTESNLNQSNPDLSKTLSVNLSAVAAGVPTLLDGVLAYFNDDLETGADDMDAPKLSNTNENTGIRSFGRTLAVDFRKLPAVGDTIFLNTANMRAQQYQLQTDAAELNTNAVVAFLEDRYTQSSVLLDLNGITLYNFSASGPAASFAADRFIIVFKSVSVLPVRFTKISAARNADKSVTVKWSTDNESNIVSQEIENSEDGTHFTVIGNTAANNTGGTASYAFTDRRAPNNSNYYRIKSKESSGRIFYSAIAKATGIYDGSKGISIYPNPIEGGKINIRSQNTPAGIYTFKITTPTGQILHTETDDLQAGSVIKTLQLPANSGPGTYMLSCTDKEGNTTTLSFINPGGNK